MSINIKKVIDICVKGKQLNLFNVGSRQWVSDGFAAYPLLGMPAFTESTIRATYSIPDNVRVKEMGEQPWVYSFEDVERSENQVFFEKIQLQIGTEPLTSVRTQAGVAFFASKYLKPLEDGENGSSGLYERINEAGQVYIVSKQGMMLEAVIVPMTNVVKPDWLEDLRELVGVLASTQ